MKFLEHTGLYSRTVAADGNWHSYEEHSPALFKHYFRFWAKRSFPDVKIPADVLKTRSELVKRRLPMIIRRLNKKGLDIGNLRFVLFVGKNCTNGHAFRDADGWVVWIPVESYATRLLVDVFVTHEIAHALHYENSRQFYFATKPEQRNFSRLLLTEGMATYLTASILDCSDDVALWGDYLRKQQLHNWRVKCERNWPLLKEIAVGKFRSHAPTELFQANDPEDVFRFRAGYYLGLNLVKEISRGEALTANEMISLPRKRLEQLALKYLSIRS